MIIKKLDLFTIYITILPLCNLAIFPIGFINPVFSIFSLPIIFYYFFILKRVSKFDIAFILFFTLLIFYSVTLGIFSQQSEFLLRSLAQYFCFAINFISISILFNNLTSQKISRTISVFLSIGILNAIFQFIQLSSVEFPNQISIYLAQLINIISNTKFFLKPSGLFPEASISSIFLLFTIVPMMESFYYLRANFPNIKKIGSHGINKLLILSFLVIIISFISRSRLLILGFTILIGIRLLNNFNKKNSFSIDSVTKKSLLIIVFLSYLLIFALPRLSSLFSIDESIFQSSGSNLTRLSLIVASLKASFLNPLGLGMGVFKSNFTEFLPPWSIYSGEINVALGEEISKYGITNPDYILDAKNYFGLLGTDFGLLITILIIYIVCKCFLKLIKRVKIDNEKILSLDDNYISLLFFKRYLINVFFLLPIVALSISSVALPFLPLPFVLANKLFKKYNLLC